MWKFHLHFRISVSIWCYLIHSKFKGLHLYICCDNLFFFSNKESYPPVLKEQIWPPGMQYRVVVRLEHQNILIWSRGVLILRRRNVTAVPASLFRTLTQQWGNLKHWEACKYLRLYSDTLLFHFHSSSIPSFQLSEEEEESTAAFLWAWAVSGDGGKVGAPVLVLLLPLLPWLGIGLPSPCHVLYIREDQQANLKVRWYQAHAKEKKTFQPPLSHIIL